MALSKKWFLLAGLPLAGCIAAFVVNVFIIQKIIIPDPCYYHSHDTNKLFDLFYEMTAAEGYHPTPTVLNLVITLAAGALTGFLIALMKIRRANKPVTKTPAPTA